MKDLHSSKLIITSFLNRFHLVIFTVATVLILSAAVLLLNGVVIKASGEDITPEVSNSSNFDQATIDQIKKLKTSSEQVEPLDLSRGRINPFGE